MNYVAIAFWSQIICSIAFVVVVVWLWIRYLEPSVLAAQEAANRQIADAALRRDAAKAEVDELRGETDKARRDADLIRERGADAAKREFEATVAEANEAGARTVRGAHGELERAIAAAQERLRHDLLSKAFALARGDAERRTDRAVNERLIGEFVTALESDRG
jgi:F0F1-type ATP synthase membrane subunit b/b'